MKKHFKMDVLRLIRQTLDTLTDRYAHKTADETRTSTTATADADMRLSAALNAVYEIEAFLVVSGGSSENYKHGFSVPVGSRIDWTDSPGTAPAAGTTGSEKTVEVSL